MLETHSLVEHNDHWGDVPYSEASWTQRSGIDIHPETIYAPTADGWKLALHIWKGRGPRRLLPVMLFHGLGANRLNLHMTRRHSLALAIANRGFDVYAAELRGAGLSRFPSGRSIASCDWGFNDYANTDVPALVERVCQLAKVPKVHAVGHSMGGMVLYAYATSLPGRLTSICAIGSPVIGALPLAFREKNLLQFGAKLATEGRPRKVPLKALAGAAGYLGPLANKILEGTLVSADNADSSIGLKVIHDATDDIPLNLVAELYRHFCDNSDESSAYSYEARLDKIDVPVFVIAGVNDRVAVPDSIREGVSRLKSRDIRFRELGKRYGDKVDYGHIDLLIGRYAPQEVYPLIADYLEEMDFESAEK